MVVGGKPAAELGALAVADHHGIAALEASFDLGDAGRQQALAARSASAAPLSTITRPFGSSVPAIQRLRAVTGSAWARNQVQPAPPASARERMEHLAAGDHHMRAAGNRDLRRLDLGDHAAARQLRADIARPSPRSPA